MLLSSYSAHEPSQPTTTAGAEAADLPAFGVPQQSKKAKPEHAGFRASAGDMPVRRCAEQQQHGTMNSRKEVMSTLKQSETYIIWH